MKTNTKEYRQWVKNQYNWFFAENHGKAVGLLRAHSILRIVLTSMTFLLAVSLLLLPIYKVNFANGWIDIFSVSVLTRAIREAIYALASFDIFTFPFIEILMALLGVMVVIGSVKEFVQGIKRLDKCKEYAGADFSVITEGLIVQSGFSSWFSFLFVCLPMILEAQSYNWIILILCFIALMQFTVYWALAELIYRRCLRSLICKAYEHKY